MTLVAACRGGFGKQRIMTNIRASGYCAKTMRNCQDSNRQRKRHSFMSCGFKIMPLIVPVGCEPSSEHLLGSMLQEWS